MCVTTGLTISHKFVSVTITMEDMTVVGVLMGIMEITVTKKQVLPRKNIMDLTDQEWTEYITILKMSRKYCSEYKIILDEVLPGTKITGNQMREINLYDLFVWLHHYAAKNNECVGKQLISLVPHPTFCHL